MQSAFGNLRKVIPVHITSSLCSTSCPYNSARSAVLQCRQQQARQVCVPKEMRPNLALHSTTNAVKALQTISARTGWGHAQLQQSTCIHMSTLEVPSPTSGTKAGCPCLCLSQHTGTQCSKHAGCYLKAILCHLIFHHPYSCVVG